LKASRAPDSLKLRQAYAPFTLSFPSRASAHLWSSAQWGGSIEAMTFSAVSRAEERANRLLAGEADIVQDLAREDVERVERSGCCRVVGQIRRGSPHLRPRGRSETRRTVDGARGLSVVLRGRSPLTGAEEHVTVVTRELPDDHVLYALFVVPGEDSPSLRPVFDRMLDSLRVNDRVAHR
jgi:hypothetical protein